MKILRNCSDRLQDASIGKLGPCTDGSRTCIDAKRFRTIGNEKTYEFMVDSADTEH